MKLQRPWLRHRLARYPERAFILTKRNYKVYNDCDLDLYRMFRVLTIHDTGAGPKFVRGDKIPDELHRFIRHSPLPDKFDAENISLPIVGSVRLPVKTETSLVNVKFTARRSLGAPAILGANFWDRFAEAIHSSKELVELVDGSTVPIVRRSMKRPPSSAPLPIEQKYKRTQGRVEAATGTL